MTAGSFRPYVWIGNAERGLAFMADNDQGWVPDDSRKVPAIEVVRAGTQVQLVLNLVARPFTFEKPREITFSLQAAEDQTAEVSSRPFWLVRPCLPPWYWGSQSSGSNSAVPTLNSQPGSLHC